MAEPWRYESTLSRLKRQQEQNMAGSIAALDAARSGNIEQAPTAYRQAASGPVEQLNAQAAARTYMGQRLRDILATGGTRPQQEEKKGGGFWGGLKDLADDVTPDFLEKPARTAGKFALSALEAPQDYIAEPLVGLSEITAERKKDPNTGLYYREKGTFGDLFQGIGRAVKDPIGTYSESRTAYREFFNNPDASVFGLGPEASYWFTEVATDPLTYVGPGMLRNLTKATPVLRNTAVLNMILAGRFSPVGAVLEGPGRKAVPFVVGGGALGSELASKINTPLSEPLEQILFTLAGSTGGGLGATRGMTFGQQVRNNWDAAQQGGDRGFMSLMAKDLLARNIDISKVDLAPEERLHSPYQAINDAHDFALVQMKLDAPGVLGQAMMDTPGFKQVIGALRPVRQADLTEEAKQVQRGWLASFGVRAKTMSVYDASRYAWEGQPGPLARLESLFGREAVAGGRVEGVEFIGPDELRYRPASTAPEAEPGTVPLSDAARARLTGLPGETRVRIGDTEELFGGAQPQALDSTQEFPGLFTIKDIAERPHLYNLAPEHIDAITSIKVRSEAQLADLEVSYGVKIPRFEAPGSLAHLPTVKHSAEHDELLLSAEEAVRTGRMDTRVYDTAYDRWLADPEFVPETSLPLLMYGSDVSKVSAMHNQVFTIASGGKTKLEVLGETHPELLKQQAAVRARINSVRARLRTATKQVQVAKQRQGTIGTRLQRQQGRVATFSQQVEDATLSNAERKQAASRSLRELKSLVTQARQEALEASRRQGVTGEQARVANRNMDTIMRRAERIQKQIDQVQGQVDAMQAGVDTRNMVIRNFQVFDEDGIGRPMTEMYLPEALRGLQQEYDAVVAQIGPLERTQFRGFEAADERQMEANLGASMAEILAEEEAKTLVDFEREAMEAALEKGAAFSAADVKGTEGHLREAELNLRALQREFDAVSNRALVKGSYMTSLEVALKEAQEQAHDFARKVDAAPLRGTRADGSTIEYVYDSNTYRYYEKRAAEEVERLRGDQKVNGIVRALSLWNQTVLSSDLSPITGVQAPLAFFANPVGVIRQAFGVDSAKAAWRDRSLLRAFSPGRLSEDIARNPAEYEAYARATGITVTNSIPEEFAGGIAGHTLEGLARYSDKVFKPAGFVFGKASKGYTNAQVGMATAVQRMQFRLWRDMKNELIKAGVPPEIAEASAGLTATQVIPRTNPALRAVSTREQAWQNASVTSVSFLTRPAEMLEDSTRAFLKVAGGYPLDPRERLALRTSITMFGMLSAIAGTTAAIHASENGEDPIHAAIKTTTGYDIKTKELAPPTDFLSLWVPGTDVRVPLGGPYRSLIRAMAPRNDDGIPFAGMLDFMKVRASAGVTAQFELLQNHDFFGNKIVASDQLIPRIAQGIQHELASLLPISVANPIDAWEEGASGSEIFQEIGAGFLGVALLPESPYAERNREVRAWAHTALGREVEGWADLLPSEKAEFSAAYPELAQKIEQQVQLRAERGDEFAVQQVAMMEVRAKLDEEQQYADAQLLNGDLTPEQWLDQQRRRQDEERYKREQIYGDAPITDPKTPVEAYIQAIQQNGLPNGEVDWDAVDLWLDSIPAAERQVIEENTSLGRTPLTRYYREVIKPMRDAYYQISAYKGYSADEAREVDAIIEQVRTEAGGGSDERRLLQAWQRMERRGDFQGIDPHVLGGARRGIRYDSRGRRLLQETSAREQFRKSHPDYAFWFGADANARPTPEKQLELQAIVSGY